MSAPRPGSDCAWLLEVLGDGCWHTTTELLSRSFHERGVGLTVHSRKSDLVNKHGYEIECEHVPGATRGRAYQYRLVTEPQNHEHAAPAPLTVPEIVHVLEEAGFAELHDDHDASQLSLLEVA